MPVRGGISDIWAAFAPHLWLIRAFSELSSSRESTNSMRLFRLADQAGDLGRISVEARRRQASRKDCLASH